VTASGLLRTGLALGAIALAVLLRVEPDQSVASSTVEERRLPMRFAWNDCGPDCEGWVSAVGVVTADTPVAFDEFARGRDLAGATIMLDSSGGSVNDALALGARWRKLKAVTSVGITVASTAHVPASVRGGAFCESMCVFLLLAGETRYVPDDAMVRVHQIWMGDRAENARAASYTAQDLMIVERDIGRLAKYSFDMGATGDLLALALSVPPWESLHLMSPAELRASRVITVETRPDRFPAPFSPAPAIAAKPEQDRIAQDEPRARQMPEATGARVTAEATGGHVQEPRH
jgi:hypothetical protein